MAPIDLVDFDYLITKEKLEKDDDFSSFRSLHQRPNSGTKPGPIAMLQALLETTSFSSTALVTSGSAKRIKANPPFSSASRLGKALE